MSYKLIYNEKEEERELNKTTTINDILKELEISPQTVVTKKNNQIIDETAEIEDEDTIKIIQVIYGG